MTKKVIFYLKGTMHLSLIYNGYLKDEREIKAIITLSPFGLIRYKDSSYARNPKNRKSVMQYCYFINKVVISCYSKKQKTVLISTTEIKYIAL